jgi:uncharacterized membrane protein
MRLLKLIPTGLVAAAVLVSAGCNNSSTGGNAGTSDSFKLKAPAMATNLKQGDRETVTVTLDRGTDFKQNVKLEATAPKGLKVDLANSTVNKADKADVAVTVEADKTAPIGEHVVKITGTPETGAATSVDFKIKVEEKK